MVSIPPLFPHPLKLKLALSVPLLIPSGRWPQAEVFSFSLAFISLDAHYTPALCGTPTLGVPNFVLQNGTFGRGLFDRLCVWLLEFDALTTQVCCREPFL